MTVRVEPRGGTLPCRLCGGPARFRFQVGDLNRGLGPGSFVYRRCERCRCTVLQEIPDDLGRYYARDGYGTQDEADLPVFVEREEAKLALISNFVERGRLVEIGPGAGLFTRIAKRRGYAVTAIEMDPRYCEMLREEVGVDVVQSADPAAALAELPAADAVVIWHAIEHLAKPCAVLERSVEVLRPGGLLAISTPNPNSLQARLLGARWAHLDAPRHLQLIPPDLLRKHLARLGASHALTTTTDPVGLECNRLGWEYAARRHPAEHPSTAVTMRIGSLLTRLLSPVERRGAAGTAYTSVFLREPAGS
jgi:SAM-dependent methyltransferase